MHFEEGNVEGPAGIHQGNRRVAEPAGVKNHRDSAPARFLDPVDDLAFVIALPENRGITTSRTVRGDLLLDIRKSCTPVDFRFPGAKQIEVGPIQDIYRRGNVAPSGGFPGHLAPGSCLRGLLYWPKGLSGTIKAGAWPSTSPSMANLAASTPR